MPETDPRPTLSDTDLIVRAEDDGVSILRFLNLCLRHWRLILGLPLAAVVVTAFVVLLWPRTYTSSASFMPQSSDGDVSQLSGLAASLGFTLPGTSAGESPEFYVTLISSRDILDATIEHPYTIGETGGGEPRTGTLIELYGVNGDTPGVRLLEARKRLAEDMQARVRADAGLVELSVRARWPELAEQIASRVLDLVNEFNLETRQSQAGDEREFVEGRLQQAQDELMVAEDSMAAFLQRNRRGYETSPELQFEYGRLQRRVTLRQDIVNTLSENYERARIDEVRNTPVITIVDDPIVPPRADRRGLIIKTLLAAIAALVIAITIAVLRDFMRNARREDPEDYAQFERLRNETVSDLRAAVGRWRRAR